MKDPYFNLPDREYEPPEPLTLYHCDECGCDIREGDECYLIHDLVFCDRCIVLAFHTAEVN